MIDILFHCITAILCNTEYAHIGEIGNIHVIDIKGETKFMNKDGYDVLVKNGSLVDYISPTKSFNSPDDHTNENTYAFYSENDCVENTNSDEAFPLKVTEDSRSLLFRAIEFYEDEKGEVTRISTFLGKKSDFEIINCPEWMDIPHEEIGK